MPKTARTAIAALALIVTAAGTASIATNASTPRSHTVMRAEGESGPAPASSPQPGDMTWG
jgi:hypothetical protein